MTNKTVLLALYGKSAAGKDTILKKLLDENEDFFRRVVRYTSRPQRDNEVDGEDYHFISDSKSKQILKGTGSKVLESHSHREWNYFTTLDSLELNSVNIGSFSEVAVRDILESVEKFGIDLIVLPIKIEAPYDVRWQRAVNRGSTDLREIERRFRTEEEDEESHDIIEPSFVFENVYSANPVPYFFMSQLYAQLDNINKGGK